MSKDTCSADIARLEKSLVAALKLADLAYHAAMRYSGDGGHAHPSLALMEISLRSLRQSNDAARYARHALSCVAP